VSSFRADTSVFRPAAVNPATGRSVSLSFASGTENPVFQNGIWMLGAGTGVDWTNMQLGGGILYGTMAAGSFDGHYCDSAALLTGYGAWNRNQSVVAAVKSINQLSSNSSDFCELEIRLRCQVNAHNFQGYEILWRCNHTSTTYHQIGWWYGPIGINGGCAVGCAFEGVTGSLHSAGNGMENTDACFDTAAATAAWGSPNFGGLYDGDSVGASLVGDQLTTWIIHNGVTVILQQFSDTAGPGGHAKFASGYPGLGHWNHSVSPPSDYGFTSATFNELL
jgi:hypothetical protein